MSNTKPNENQSMRNFIHVVSVVLLFGLFMIVMLVPSNDIVAQNTKSNNDMGIHLQQSIEKIELALVDANVDVQSHAIMIQTYAYVRSIWSKQLAYHYDVTIDLNQSTLALVLSKCVEMSDSDIELTHSFGIRTIECPTL